MTDVNLPTEEEIRDAERKNQQAYLRQLAENADGADLIDELEAIGKANGATAVVIIAERLRTMFYGDEEHRDEGYCECLRCSEDRTNDTYTQMATVLGAVKSAVQTWETWQEEARQKERAG